jgi:microcystin-dependent protein
MEGYVSEIHLYVGGHTPSGWFPCDGRELNIEDYQLLFDQGEFNLQSNTTFLLPKLTSPFPNTHYIICVNGYYEDFVH